MRLSVNQQYLNLSQIPFHLEFLLGGFVCLGSLTVVGLHLPQQLCVMPRRVEHAHRAESTARSTRYWMYVRTAVVVLIVSGTTRRTVQRMRIYQHVTQACFSCSSIESFREQFLCSLFQIEPSSVGVCRKMLTRHRRAYFSLNIFLSIQSRSESRSAFNDEQSKRHAANINQHKRRAYGCREKSCLSRTRNILLSAPADVTFGAVCRIFFSNMRHDEPPVVGGGWLS